MRLVGGGGVVYLCGARSDEEAKAMEGGCSVPLSSYIHMYIPT